MVLACQFMGNETLWAASHKGELPSCQDNIYSGSKI